MPPPVPPKLLAPRLQRLYQAGKLDGVLQRFRDEMTAEHLLGSGDDASTFRVVWRHRNGNDIHSGAGTGGRGDRHGDSNSTDPSLPPCRTGEQVLKLCVKSVRYFRHGPRTPDRSGRQFALDSRAMVPFVLPVRRLLYEDDNVFVYTQDCCSRYDKSNVHPEQVVGIFEAALAMISRAQIRVSLAPHHLGVRDEDGAIVVFDFHDMRTFKWHGGNLHNKGWWQRLMQHLACHAAYAYADPAKIKRYRKWACRLTGSGCRRIAADGVLPSSVLRLLQYHHDCSKSLQRSTVRRLLHECVTELRQRSTIISGSAAAAAAPRATRPKRL